MQGIVFKTADTDVRRGDVLPVYIHDNIICDFKVESLTEIQAVGDFTTNVEANLQFTIINDLEGRQRVVPTT